MSKFGETLRDLRVARDLGLRETAVKAGISPAYLSRIERGKERPPSPEIIKSLAKELAADPDVLFRLSSTTDPEVVDYLCNHQEILSFLRYLQESSFNESQLELLFEAAKKISSGELDSMDGLPGAKRGRVA